MIILQITPSHDDVLYSYSTSRTGSFQAPRLEQATAPSSANASTFPTPTVAISLPPLTRTLPSPSLAKTNEESESFSTFIWPAAFVLGALMVQHSGMLAGSSILELGAGRAFNSIIANGLGAAKVVSTDRESRAVEYVVRKPGEAVCKSEIKVDELRWGVFTRDTVEMCKARVDIVLASDVWYSECGAGTVEERDVWDAFMATFSLIKRHNPNVSLMTAVVNRSDRQMKTIRDMLSAWNCRIIQSYQAEDLLSCSSEVEIRSVEAWIIQGGQRS